MKHLTGFLGDPGAELDRNLTEREILGFLLVVENSTIDLFWLYDNS